jgi:light-regulated signal transduction histidine kinase (bacteriophytochrome)
MSNSVEAPQERVEELERLLEQRTAELREARKDLDDFNYSVSHDLRAPLRHINGYAKILEEDYGGRLDPQCLHYLESIAQSAQKMSALLDDLTKLSHVGRQELSLQPVKLDALVRDLVREFDQKVPQRKIEWKIGVLPEINGDAALLRQVFFNLLANAVKFTRPRAHAVIEIGVDESSKETIFVRDNGIGFDMKYADKLFTIFQRLHAQQEFEGRGAGLAIAKRILTKHGGRCWTQAASDQGATFYLTLRSGDR